MTLDMAREIHRLAAIMLLLVGSFAGSPARAAIDVAENVTLRGFATLGAVWAGDNSLGYRSNLSQPGTFGDNPDLGAGSLFGVQLDARLNQAFGAAVQLVAKERADNSLANSVEWAYLAYRPNYDLTLRAGRLGVDLFMLSDHRNVGFAYPWAHPPLEFYGAIAFDHFDGLDISRRFHFDQGTLSAKLFGGVATNTFTSMLGDVELDLEPIIGGNLVWETDALRLRASLATVKFASSVKQIQPLLNGLNQAAGLGWPQAAGIASDLDAQGKQTNYYALGAAYDAHPWSTQAEFSYIDSDYSGFPSLLGGYLSIGRRVGSVTLFGVGAMAQSVEERTTLNSAPPPWFGLQAIAQSAYDLSRVKQRSLSLGLRWDLRHDLALKAQWDHTWIDNDGGLWLQARPLTSKREMDTFTLNLNYVF